MGVLNYWFFKRATDTETGQVFYYFRMVEPDFTPLPVYEAMKAYANQPPEVYPGYHQEDHWALQWEGQWETVADDQAVLDALRRSSGPGNRLRFTFVGTDLELVVGKGPQMGALQVSTDGQAAREITLSAGTPEHGARIRLVTRLRNGPHDVEITTAGDPAAEVDIDGIIVRVSSARWWPYALVLGVIMVVAGLLLHLHERDSRPDYD
jgi:hypothetical protein